jgi:hypothetical protein
MAAIGDPIAIGSTCKQDGATQKMKTENNLCASSGQKVSSESSDPKGRHWIGRNDDPSVATRIHIKGSREGIEEYRTFIPSEMYAHPYIYTIRVVVTQKHATEFLPPALPWGEGCCRFTLRLVEADSLSSDRLQSALSGEGATGMLCTNPNSQFPNYIWDCEGRFWIEKGYISYHFQSKQFRLVALLHNSTTIWHTYISAPFTCLAKRKERIHDYNSVSAKYTRETKREARRIAQGKALATEIGMNEAETQQAHELFTQLTSLKRTQQHYILRLWTGCA